MMDTIEALCRKYTSLAPADIAVIQGMSTVLGALASWEEADIFVDCPCRDGDAIVVAEAKPDGAPSSYRKSVVGLLARRENEPAVARTLRLGVGTKQMKALTQENRRTVQSVEPIKNSAGKVIGALVREQRMDERRQASGRLHFSDRDPAKIANALAHMAGNDWLTECIDEALLIVDRTGRVAFCNSLARSLYQTLGYLDDPLGQRYENVRLAEVREEDGQAGYAAAEVTLGRHSLLVKQIRLAREDMAFAVIVQDLTWKREQEKQLVLKSAVVKEMHHRVKNSLQTVASLLRLQMRRLDDAALQDVLAESMNRILSIATTHELLSRSGVDEVMIGEVIRNIRNNIIRAFSWPDFHVQIRQEGDDFPVNSDIATSAALVINELLQNSLQYAFRGREQGSVRIVVTRGELYSCIEVIDDGCGYDTAAVRPDSLGLSIVRTMVEDRLHGSLKTEAGSGGTHVTFDFKNQYKE